MTPMHEPLTPADCDLRGLAFMPLDVVRLLDSDLFAISTGDEFKAAVSLWCKSWLQMPAASLPDDDRVLCSLAGFGRDLKAWMKVRAMAMRGWVLCDDGRWYHAVIAVKACEAWKSRLKQREKSARGNEKRWGKPSKGDPHGDARSDPHGDPHGDPTRDRKGQGEGEREGEEEIPGRTHTVLVHAAPACVETQKPPNPPPVQPTAAAMACMAMRAEGIADVNPAHPKLAALLAAGATAEELAQAARGAVQRGKGFAYAIGTALRQRSEAESVASALHTGPMPSKSEALRARNHAAMSDWLANEEPQSAAV